MNARPDGPRCLAPRAAITLVVLLILPITATAGADVDAGLIRITARDRFDETTCSLAVAVPVCVASFEPGGEGGVGESSLDVYQHYYAVEVELRPSMVPIIGEELAALLPDESLVLRYRDASFRHPLFVVYNELRNTTGDLPGEGIVKIEHRPDGQVLHHPFGKPERMNWSRNDAMDYEHVRGPAHVTRMSTDTELRRAGASTCRSERPELAMVAGACRTIGGDAATAALAAALPDARTGFAVEKARVSSDTQPPLRGRYASELAEASIPQLSARGMSTSPPELPAAAGVHARIPDPPPFDPPEVRREPVMRASSESLGWESGPGDGASAGHLFATAAAVTLLLGPVLALYRRLTRHDLLTQATRQRLLDLVAAQPGIALVSAARALGVQHRAVDYHAHLLQQAGCLVVERHRGHVRLFAAGARPPGARDDPARAALLNPTARRLLLALARAREATRGELALAAGVPATTTNWHVRRLREVGLVEESADAHGPALLRLAPARREAVVDVLLGFEPARPPARAG